MEVCNDFYRAILISLYSDPNTLNLNYQHYNISYLHWCEKSQGASQIKERMGSFTNGRAEQLPWGQKMADDIFCIISWISFLSGIQM